MRNNIYMLLVIILGVICCTPQDVTARSKKKKGKTGEAIVAITTQETAYDRLFKGKNVVTSNGVMRAHLVDGKSVYLEIPENVLGKDMLYFSTIDKSSDSGEGYIGDRSKVSFGFRFAKEGKYIGMQLLTNVPVSLDENINKALIASNVGVTLFSYPVKATTADSSAYVVDITEFVLGDSPRTNPFPANSGSSMMGILQQTSSYKREQSHLLDVRGGELYTSIQAELAYRVAGSLGDVSTATRPLQMHVSRHFVLLPDEPMEERPADPRLNLKTFAKVNIPADSYISNTFNTVRWNIRPQNNAPYQPEQLVEPDKPIVFYIDTLMPNAWKKGVTEGILEWNKAFEAIGFKNVLQVKNIPADKDFDIDNPYISVIHYAVNQTYVSHVNTTVDPRTGEILSGSITLPSGLADAIQIAYKMVAMVHEPDVRQRSLPEDKFIALLQGTITDYIGGMLGFRPNSTALYAYGVEDLRSPDFTRAHGLFPSIVGNSGVYNYIAQPEDVKKGTLLYQNRIGEYDYFAVKCLYQPMPRCSTFFQKSKVLDQWIAAVVENPVYHYRQAQLGDVSSRAGILSNDPVKASEYRIKNLKIVAKNFMQWYTDDDRELGVRGRMGNLLVGALWKALDGNDALIGGIIFNDDYAIKNGFPMYTFISKKEQEAAVKTNLEQLNDVSWLYVKELDELLFKDFSRGMTYNSCMINLFKRIPALCFANQICTDPKCFYPVEDYVRILHDHILKKTKKGQIMNNIEKNLQTDWIQKMIATAELTDFIGTPPEVPTMGVLGLRSIGGAGQNETDYLLHMSPVVNQNIEGDVNAYLPRGRELPLLKYSVAPLFFKLLRETKELMEQGYANSIGSMKQHYKYCLYMINTALEAKK